MLKSLDLTDYTKQDISKARKLCDLVLSENPVALPPLHPECLITILVPVYNESETRIKEQIQAFTKQRFAKHHFEIVFVVNNPKIKITPLEVLDANTAVINFLESKRHAVPTQVLDRSSKNHELKKGNVGEARNYGIHVVTKRYIEQQRDGIIIQVDADTIPTNINYLHKIWKDFNQKKVYGAAGGVRFVLSLDSQNAQDRAFFNKHLPTVRNYVQWNFYLAALEAPLKSLTNRIQPNTFSGAHMISRAVASVCAGGIEPVGSAEDVRFGNALAAYAKKNNATILARRDEWIVNTSLRESLRTGSSFGIIFDNIRVHGDHPLVRSITTPHYLTFLKTELKKINKTKPISKDNIIKALNYDIDLTKKEQLKLNEFCERIREAKSDKQRMKIYDESRQASRDEIIHKIFNRLFRCQYPRVPLTKHMLQKLKAEVNKNPKRKEHAENAIKYLATFHLK